MNDIINKYLEEHDKRIEKYGINTLALWGSKESQEKRFETLCKLFINNNKFSVLDLGSGLSQFFPFLKSKGFFDFEYLGVEVNEKFIHECKKTFPDINITKGSVEEFIAKNKKVDYIVASGLYNLGNSVEEAEAFFLEQFKKLYKITNVGFAVNFLSIHSQNKDGKSIYHNPKDMLGLCIENFSSHVILDQSYLPHDFTIFVYKKLKHD